MRLHPQRLPGFLPVQSRRPSPRPGLRSLAPLLSSVASHSPPQRHLPAGSLCGFPRAFPPAWNTRPCLWVQPTPADTSLLSRHLLCAAPHPDPLLPRCPPDPGGVEPGSLHPSRPRTSAPSLPEPHSLETESTSEQERPGSEPRGHTYLTACPWVSPAQRGASTPLL